MTVSPFFSLFLVPTAQCLQAVGANFLLMTKLLLFMPNCAGKVFHLTGQVHITHPKPVHAAALPWHLLASTAVPPRTHVTNMTTLPCLFFLPLLASSGILHGPSITSHRGV